jgi:hypothetical protein
MHRPTPHEFLETLLASLDDLPPDLLRRLQEILTKEHPDRAQAIRLLFEELAGG